MTTALGSSAHDWLVSLRRGGKGSAIDFFEIDFIGKGERETEGRGGGVEAAARTCSSEPGRWRPYANEIVSVCEIIAANHIWPNPQALWYIIF